MLLSSFTGLIISHHHRINHSEVKAPAKKKLWIQWGPNLFWFMKTAHKIYKKGLQGRFRRDPNFSNKLVLAASFVHAKAKSMAAVSWCPPIGCSVFCWRASLWFTLKAAWASGGDYRWAPHLPSPADSALIFIADYMQWCKFIRGIPLIV